MSGPSAELFLLHSSFLSPREMSLQFRPPSLFMPLSPSLFNASARTRVKGLSVETRAICALKEELRRRRRSVGSRGWRSNLADFDDEELRKDILCLKILELF